MSRNILLLVTGNTTQIITETVWALACDPENAERWVPDEIRVVTTTDGIKAIKDTLLGNQQLFNQLLADYSLPKIKFDSTCLVAIKDENGQELSDLKSPKDNEWAADMICGEIQELTAQDDVSLHVSIAGGRKTMGFYAGYALSLYGRTQDRMSHVLVSTEFESLRGFYYPAPKANTKTIRKQIKKIENNVEFFEEVILDTFDAKVWLANIPFVRLRGSLPKSSLINEAKFSDVVESINLANHPQVVVNIAEKKISVGSLDCVLPAREFAFYWWFSANHAQGAGKIIAPNKEITANANTKDDYPELIELADAYLSYYARLKDEMSSDSVQHTLRNGMERSFFDERMTSIKKKFKQAFGADITARIEIANLHRISSKIEKQRLSNSAKADEKRTSVPSVGTYGLIIGADQMLINSDS